jgi:uncharacterized protein (TIGR02145 family)
MKKIFILILGITLAYSCSTSSDGNGNSTTTVLPVAPTNLTGTVASTTQINLSWTDNSTNETGFKIERKTGTGTYAVIGTTATDITTYSDTDLTQGTTYTYRVYSYNLVGGSNDYSNEFTLNLSNSVGNVWIQDLKLIGLTSDRTNYSAQILVANGANVIEYGIVWDSNINPTINLSTKTIEASVLSASGFFEGSIPQILIPSTYYHARIYAKTNIGVFYGQDTLFNTTTPISDIEGNIYETVLIGDKLWTTKNLNVSKYSDGTPIQHVENVTQLSNMSIGAWCYMDNNPVNGSYSGKLYNWYAAVGIYDVASYNNPALRKSLAPQGFHVPSLVEWNNIRNVVGPNAGGMMKTTGNITQGTGLWKYPNTGATNFLNFNAFPAGNRDGGPTYPFTSQSIISKYTGFMLTTEEYSGSNSIYYAWKGVLSFDNLNIIGCCASPKDEFFSIRCISN